MKIALVGPTNDFTRALREHLHSALAADALLDWQPKTPAPADDFDVLIAIGAVTREMLEAQPSLKVVQTASDGYDAVDLDAATELGVWVSYTPGAASGNADSVAEYAVMLLIAANRQVAAGQRFIRDHRQPRPMLTPSLIGKTVCVYGFGDIGERVAARLKPFGVKLSGVTRRAGEISDPEVQAFTVEHRREALGSADAVVLCVRGNQENEHLVNAGFLSEMKPGSTLVNIARGSLVDEGALLDAIRNGHLGAAGLDVQEHEPIGADSPLVTQPGTFVTPHIAGFTDHTLEGTATYLVKVVGQIRAGQRPGSLINKPETPRFTWH